MLLPMSKKLKHIIALCIGLLLMNAQPLWAAGPPAPSLFNNTVEVSFLILIVLLLIIIAILANILMGVAEIKVKKDKKSAIDAKTTSAMVIFLILSNSLSAQNNTTAVAAISNSSVGGMSSQAFYFMASVIFLELLVILVLLVNIRMLLKQEKEKLGMELAPGTVKKPSFNWWARFNRFRPVEQEADIDLGHDYDGIRELDNRLPPWWLYGFYLTILVAGIYLWRYQVSHTGPSSKEEYETAVANADMEVKEYLKMKGDAVDENTVKILSSADDLAAGKTLFLKSCVACHKEAGGGDVGPNLTDEYWIHGGDIKSIFKTIRYGINAMPQWQNSYSNKQIAQLASYVRSLIGTTPPNPKAPQGVLYKEDSVAVKASTDTTVKVSNIIRSQ
jgi:cytochrome c oxidase cbb3-type subunit III